ncbi:ABC-F family ATP-binding cassette domain-containing protein [Abyssisolibacter fermentans]|uniref:ABC-F family ATP-binding cassette domain-containing protein n=1 Tax=Abyssisolibacter fermentans TaxID=1766203 RepID=UPI00082EF862|nr:ABC-F family ATP-binding cassette domain-containing protein [Abyssisolibacter fermentans]
MIVLSCTNISKTYVTDKILDDVSFSINSSEKVGLIGINGAGKTTLFNILMGKISKDSGQVYTSKTSKIGHLEQHSKMNSNNNIYQELLEIFEPIINMEKTLRNLEHEISKESVNPDSKVLKKLMNKYSNLTEEFADCNGYGYESEIKGVLKGLGFNEEQFSQPINELSGGQKTRIFLAKLLLKKPDILLLDEPTNHLDLESIDWLEKFLKDYKGSIIIVSHDRYFLDNVVTRILQLEDSKLKSYNGNYSTYIDKRKKELELMKKKYELQKDEINRQKEIIKNLSLGGKRAIRQAQSREKMLKKMDELKKPPSERKKANITFTPSIKSGNNVLFVEALAKSFNNKKLFNNIGFNIYKNEKVGIIGPNGIGKSTLFKIIMGKLDFDSGNFKLGHNVNIGYFDQEQENLNYDKTIMDEIWDEHTYFNHYEIRSILAQFLFTGDDIFKEISTLSGGERSRLALLKLMLSKANFLLMDEPTNHLDVDSKEVLEDSLLKYEGTVLVISHDRYFLNKVANKILYFDKNMMQEYLGNYDYYVEKKNELNSVETEENDQITKTKMKLERKKQKQLQKEQRMLKKQVKETEAKILELENKINEYEQLLCKPDVYNNPQTSSDLNKELVKTKNNLEAVYEKWVELND